MNLLSVPLKQRNPVLVNILISSVYFALCSLHVISKEGFILHHSEAVLIPTVSFGPNVFIRGRGSA